MAFDARGTFSVDLSLFGSRIRDVAPADLPAGVSPDNQNCWFMPGMVATRPAFQRVLAPIAGNPDILTLAEYRALNGALPTVFVDANGAIWQNDPAMPGTTQRIGSTIAGETAKFTNFDGKLWGAFFSPAEASAFSSSAFVGTGVPLYWNGSAWNRVTTDAPGMTPTFSNVPTVAQALTGATGGVSLTVSAAQSAGLIGGSYDIPGRGYIAYEVFTQMVYTVTSAPPSSLVGQSVTVSGLTGTNASVANTTAACIAITGTTFTLQIYSTLSVNLSAQSGTAVTSSTTYLQRSGNVVTVWLGTATLPNNFKPGFWASVLNSNSTLINGPNWTITSISRDATGLVTVTVSSQLANLPPGTQLYITPPATAFSGTVSVTNGQPTVSWVSGSQFSPDMAGNTITINSVAYQVLTVGSATSLTLASNVTSSTGSYSYSASVQQFPTGYQTVYQVLSVGASSTTFTFSSVNTEVASTTGAGGTVYQTWSPQLGTLGNAAQIITAAVDPNNGAYFQFWQLGPDTTLATGQGTISSPQAQIQGQVAAGIRSAVLMFQSADGAITAPSQIVQISVAGGTNLLQASGIVVGPPGTTQRILAFTPYLGSNWYYLAAATLPNITGLGETIVLGTIITDNTSTSFTVDFSDSQLTGGTQIDAPGNDLFNQFVLPPCLGVEEYQDRLHWWGAINNVRNLRNMGFEGGYSPPSGSVSLTNGSINVSWSAGAQFVTGSFWTGAQIALGGTLYTIQSVTNATSLLLTTAFTGTTGTYAYSTYSPSGATPPGWTAAGQVSLEPSIAAPNGFAVFLGGGANPNLTQNAFQDEFGAPILFPNTKYLIRFMAEADGANPTVTFALSSASTGFSTSVTLTPATQTSWMVANFLQATPATIPSDMVLTIAGTNVLLDELELIYAANPVENQTVHSSYADNPFGYDAITGILQIDASESITATFKQRGYMYLLSDLSLFQTKDNGQTEPEGWQIVEYASDCGASGPLAVDTNEDIAWWAGRYGARVFNGNPQPRKISQEIASDWELTNWAAQTLIWTANDPVQRVVYFGLPQNAATKVNTVLPMNYRLNDDQYNVPDPIHVSTYSGRMIATDLGRKWTIWTPGMLMGAMCTRPTLSGNGNSRQMVFAGQAKGNLYTQDVINYPPLNPQATAWNAADADYGQIGSYYVPYFFPEHLLEQNPILGNYRKLFRFLGIHITGVGNCTLTPLVDSLSNPWPAFPAFELSLADPGFDYQIPLNARGDRMSMKISVAPLAGQQAAAFMLTHLIFSAQVDRVFPIRGGAFV